MTTYDSLDDELPLAGLKVLDASTFIAGPAAATVLGDWGAEVIKIEAPGIGDPHRHAWRGANYPQAAANYPWQLDGRNKRSIALDLKQSDGRRVFDLLVKDADVLVVNFPQPVRERLRLRWEDVRETNPRLIYASLSSYGESGPDASIPAFDITAYFARTGILDGMRYAGEPPVFSLSAMGDRPSAMSLVSAIMIGLFRRERTGRGGWVGTSLFGNGLWANANLAAASLLGAKSGPRPSRQEPRSAFLNHYRAQDGRWFSLLLPQEEKRWPAFCAAVDQGSLEKDQRFSSGALRRDNAVALVAELDRIFATQPWEYWRDRLIPMGAAIAPIARIDEFLSDVQTQHAGVVLDTQSNDVPKSIANPVRLGFAEPRVPGVAPKLGEHTEEILRGLGYDENAIANLKATGAAA